MTSRSGGAAAETVELADLIAAAVTSCPSVAGLTQIPGAPVATYLRGRTVSGVAVRADEVEVCVVARFGVPLPQVAAQIRQAVVPLVPDRIVDVVIADITAPEATPAPAPAPGAAPGAASASAPGSGSAGEVRQRTTAKREESANG